MMWIGLRRYRLHFSNGDNRQKPHKQEEHREKQTERPNVGPDIDPGGRIKTPARREEIAMQRHDNHEPFKPHPDIHENRENPDNHDIAPDELEPEKLRREHIATDHPP